MGKSKSVPDLASKAMVAWTSEDVKQWLKEHESLNKYTKQLKVSSKLGQCRFPALLSAVLADTLLLLYKHIVETGISFFVLAV